MILNQIRIHGTALMAYGWKYSERMNFGKRSVEESVVKTKASANNVMFNAFFLLITNQSATPVIAIMNVGDSAL